jgi:hypothetical protein
LEKTLRPKTRTKVKKREQGKAYQTNKPLQNSGLFVFKAVKLRFAVRGGFEPPEQFPVRQFSKLVV